MKKKILIIGSSGFIGSTLSKKLKKNFIIFKSHTKKKRIIDMLNYRNLEIFVKKKKIDYILNLSGQSTENKLNENSIKGNQNLLKLTKKFEFLNIIYFSSSLIYGEKKLPASEIENTQPICNYSKIKKKVEKLYLNRSKQFRILRIANIYDLKTPKKTGLICNIKKVLKNDDKLTIPSLNLVRNYLLLDDLCNIILIILKNYTLINQNIINIGHENLSIKKIINIFEKKYKKKINTRIISNKLNPSIPLNINKMKSIINIKRLNKLKDII